MNAIALLDRLNDLKVELKFNDGQLTFNAPKGVMNSVLSKSIGSHRDSLIHILNDRSWKVKQEYSRLLRRFREIEAMVEASGNQHATFLDNHDEWLNLANRLTDILRKLETYTHDEALNGFRFSPCDMGGGK
jgi:hypothetical protein